MTDSDITIRSKGVKKATRKFKPEEAIAEYVWNGFDAGAVQVSIDYEFIPGTRKVKALRISDDGRGIPSEELQAKFSPFLESEKGEFKNTNYGNPTIKGENGFGRFTFHKFSPRARWVTRYKDGEVVKEYSIEIKADSLTKFASTQPKKVNQEVGTTVVFENPQEIIIKSFINQTLIPFLKLEFAWYLELHVNKNKRILLNNEELDYEELVLDRENQQWEFKTENPSIEYLFEVRYTQWRQKLNDEYSNTYYVDSSGTPISVKTTKFNNKGDGFYHSVYVTSALFDEFREQVTEDQSVHKQILGSVYKKGIIELEERVYELLRNKRKPILRQNADVLIHQYEENGVLPTFGNNEWDTYRKAELETLIKELYEVEPKVFFKLNEVQRKIFVRFLNEMLDQDNRADLLSILDDVMQLSSDEKIRLLKLLEVTKLSHIIELIELIRDRAIVVDQLRQLVFNAMVRIVLSGSFTQISDLRQQSANYRQVGRQPTPANYSQS